ncbi:hypothetical protein CICLE_v10013295mg [Citrus x clementina]|uniref:Uncharacterized protein n=1 Tax=Citrus clementina TaxID=85681 RepID=V4SLP1_CITCL|nr:hypothetical protein CICLE_v10013295mg [Citrus x clementina]
MSPKKTCVMQTPLLLTENEETNTTNSGQADIKLIIQSHLKFQPTVVLRLLTIIVTTYHQILFLLNQ